MKTHCWFSMKTIVKGDLLGEPFDRAGRSCLLVKEDGVDAALKRLYVSWVPAGSYVIALDGVKFSVGGKRHPISQFSLHFKKDCEGINKICDALFVHPVGCELNVSLVDLKSYSPSIPDAKKQLDNSEIFVKYISDLLGYHYGRRVGNVSKRVVKAGAVGAKVGGGLPVDKVIDDMKVISLVVHAGAAEVSWARLFDQV